MVCLQLTRERLLELGLFCPQLATGESSKGRRISFAIKQGLQDITSRSCGEPY